MSQYLGEAMESAPPAPPAEAPPAGALRLFPGYTDYTVSAPNNALIYTQQPMPQQQQFQGRPDLKWREDLVRSLMLAKYIVLELCKMV